MEMHFKLFFVFSLTVYNLNPQIIYPQENFLGDTSFNVRNRILAMEEGMNATQERLKEKENMVKEKEKEINKLKAENEELLIKVQESSFDTILTEMCSIQPKLVLAHWTECHLFYNCSSKTSLHWTRPPAHLLECTYPYVFSVTTERCENYTDVDCGNRTIPTWVCDYSRNRCTSSHCIPCQHRYPKCSDKADGLWEWESRYPSPYYKIFKDGRTISTGYCNSVWDSTAFPYNGTCTSLYNIPSSYGGLLPSCNGTTDGSYRFSDGRCDRYFTCNNGVAKAVKCESDFYFDILSGSCQYMAKCP